MGSAGLQPCQGALASLLPHGWGSLPALCESWNWLGSVTGEVKLWPFHSSWRGGVNPFMSLSSSGEREGTALVPPAALEPPAHHPWSPFGVVLGGHSLLPALPGAGLALLSCYRARQGEIRQSIPPHGMGCDCLLEGEGSSPCWCWAQPWGALISHLQGQGEALIPGREDLRRLGWQTTAVGERSEN